MSIYWGVDSSTPATWPTGGSTLFDQVTQWAGGTTPDFWGRYIGGKYSLTQAEANFIFTESEGACRILIIYNGATANSVQGDYNAGVTDANKAINAALALSIPADTYIYADIEAGWSVSVMWIIGWWETMFNSSYANPGGFYCNPLPWNAKNFSIPFMSAWTTQVDPYANPLYNPPIYSNELEAGCSYYNPGAATAPPNFAPAEIAGYTGDSFGPVSIWQYAKDCVIGGVKVGLDLAADDDAYSTMWVMG